MATAQQSLNLPFTWRSLWPIRRTSAPAIVQVDTQVLPTPADLLRIAVSQNADLDRLAQLMDLHERWEKNQARKAFVTAINAFKNNPPEIVKNMTASFKTKKGDDVSWDYASLDHICDAVITGFFNFSNPRFTAIRGDVFAFILFPDNILQIKYRAISANPLVIESAFSIFYGHSATHTGSGAAGHPLF